MTTQTYPVGIVGESHYQHEISQCREGETVRLFRERGNPYDQHAIVVKSSRNKTIGYISRDSFLRDFIHRDQGFCLAHIKSIRNVSGNLAVDLECELHDELGPIPEVSYAERSDKGAKSKKKASGTSAAIAGLLGSFVKSLFKDGKRKRR